MIAAFRQASPGLGAWRHRAGSATENVLIDLIWTKGPPLSFQLGGVNVGRSCDLASFCTTHVRQ